MEKPEISEIHSSAELEEPMDEIQRSVEALPKVRNWDGQALYNYKGFWCPEAAIRGMISYQRHFVAQDTDLLLAPFPKCGTTWLKALTFSIVNRTKFSLQQTPLLTTHPQLLVPSLEFEMHNIYELNGHPCPRIFCTHTPYNALPHSIIHSKCRIVHICRNPLDQFISHLHFIHQNRLENNAEPPPIDEAFDLFCKGIHRFGPFFDHVLSYWEASIQNPGKVLFLKYEDLKGNIKSQVKKLAEFLGFPFSVEEEEQWLIDEISRLCSFENLKNSEVNKTDIASRRGRARFSSFYRKGEVGDWVNYLTPSMVERFENVMQEKLGDSGLTFGPFSMPKS